MKDLKSIYTNVKEYEKDIELEILTVLNRYGFFWKVDYAGKLVKGKWRKNKHPYVLSGMPDIQGIIAGGQPFYLEVKTRSEYLKIMRNWDKYKIAPKTASETIQRYKRQILMVEKLRSFGCVAEFIYSIEQALSIVKNNGAK